MEFDDSWNRMQVALDSRRESRNVGYECKDAASQVKKEERVSIEHCMDFMLLGRLTAKTSERFQPAGSWQSFWQVPSRSPVPEHQASCCALTAGCLG